MSARRIEDVYFAPVRQPFEWIKSLASLIRDTGTIVGAIAIAGAAVVFVVAKVRGVDASWALLALFSLIAIWVGTIEYRVFGRPFRKKQTAATGALVPSPPGAITTVKQHFSLRALVVPTPDDVGVLANILADGPLPRIEWTLYEDASKERKGGRLDQVLAAAFWPEITGLYVSAYAFERGGITASLGMRLAFRKPINVPPFLTWHTDRPELEDGITVMVKKIASLVESWAPADDSEQAQRP
jgi:hypothetical protein